MVSSTLSEPSEESSKKGQVLVRKHTSPKSMSEKSGEQVSEKLYESDSSEDDVEVVPDFVDNFYISDSSDKVVSIFELPLLSSMLTSESSTGEDFYLFGKHDNGLQPVMHSINMWKLELGGEPEFSVKTLQGKWIRLGKPAKSYEAGECRAALVVVHFLNFLNSNVDASESVVWAHLQKVFSFSDVAPSSSDLVQHGATIRKLVKEYPLLEQSQIIGSILKKRKGTDEFISQKKQKSEEATNDLTKNENIEKSENQMTAQSFMRMGDNSDVESDGELDDSDEEDIGDNVCAICDDGGDIICCDGPCLRSFHATKAAAAKSASQCLSLGLSMQDIKDMAKFYCWNCQYKQHQCFACGKLGSSEGPSKEVVICDVALCGHFYHPACAADLLVPKEDRAAFIERVQAGVEAFSCPLHKCVKCKKGDMKGSEETRLYGCRRCPRAYHKQCISDKITFYRGEDEDEEDENEEDIRGWEMDGTRFIYCLRHEIDEDLGTPLRDHLIFPNGHKIGGAKDYSLKKERKATQVGTSLSHVERARPIKRLSDATPPRKKSDSKAPAKEPDKPVFKKPPPVPVSYGPVAKKKIATDTPLISPIKAKRAPSYNEDEIKKMLESLVEASKKTVTSDTVSAKLMIPFIYQEHRVSVKKSISLGKLDSVLHALYKARECLLRGGVEEAELLFPEESIRVLERSKNKLRVYLAPVLHGMRYTSFGRHFTKIDKLKEVVNRLHWYVNPGDMVVDFCCGANDFSRLMFQKLEKTGKKCEYKNFDIIQPKYDFNFTKKDWLKVERNELPSGDRLIMGLNPPFGVKAQLANTMVEHALTFKPKIIVLIVPKETRRLESNGYDCIWEDPYLLSGQAFYFPGSVDVNDKALSQENLDAPPLYLWSRTDWAARHRNIASARGHENFSDPNYQPIPEPDSPPANISQIVPENRELTFNSVKDQRTTTTYPIFRGSGEDATNAVQEDALTASKKFLDSVLSSKAKASDGCDFGKSIDKKTKASYSEKSALKTSTMLSIEKGKGLKQSKEGSKSRRELELSNLRSEQVSRTETSRRRNSPPRHRDRARDVRDRSEMKHHRKSPERKHASEHRGFDSRDALRNSKHMKEQSKSRDSDRTGATGRHGVEERFPPASDGRRPHDDQRAPKDRQRYEESRPTDKKSYADDLGLESFSSLQGLQMQEEELESLRRMEEFIKAEERRNFFHPGLSMELLEANRHLRSPLDDAPFERTQKPLETVSSETDRISQTVFENLHEKAGNENVERTQLQAGGQNADTRRGLDEGLRNRGFSDERRPEHLQDLNAREEDRRGYLEDKQRLEDSRGLLHSAGFRDVLPPEMLAHSSVLDRLNSLTGHGSQLGDGIHLNTALLDHQRQLMLQELHLGRVPLEAQRDHHARNLFALEMERELLRLHGSKPEHTEYPFSSHANLPGASIFGLPGVSAPGEASAHMASLLRREAFPRRDLPILPTPHSESSLLGHGNILGRNSGVHPLSGDLLGRLPPSFELENAALRGLIHSGSERHPLALSGPDFPLDPRGLPPELLLRNPSLGALGLGHHPERLDMFNSSLFRNER